ncbi:PH domain protein, partial [Ichthyophthirius multifiliis]
QQNLEGIQFALDIENISIFAIDIKGIPFAKITFYNARLFCDKTDERILVNIECSTIDGSYFEAKNKEDQIYIEFPLIGDLGKFGIHNRQEITDLTHLIKQIKNNKEYRMSEYKQFNIISQINDCDFYFKIKIDQKTSDKYNSINIQNITIVAQMGILLRIGRFTKLDDDISETQLQPVCKIPNLFDQEEESNKKGQDYFNFPKNYLELTINVKNVLICSSCITSTNILTVRGEFNIGMKWNKQSQILQNVQENTHIIQEQNFEIQGLEIFICDYEEMSQTDFKRVKKREIFASNQYSS